MFAKDRRSQSTLMPWGDGVTLPGMRCSPLADRTHAGRDGRMGGDLRLDDDQTVCHSPARNLRRWSTAQPSIIWQENDIRMAPKRPNKRRLEDDGHGRHSKKGPGKNKREVTYDTYDEAMDGESADSAQWSAEADGQVGWRWKRRASGIGMVTKWAPVDRCVELALTSRLSGSTRRRWICTRRLTISTRPTMLPTTSELSGVGLGCEEADGKSESAVYPLN